MVKWCANVQLTVGEEAPNVKFQKANEENSKSQTLNSKKEVWR